MKISKKILTMFLCGFIAVGASQLSTLVKADAATVTQSVAQKGEKWRLGIRLKLRAKRNMLYKEWRQIDLVCEEDGSLQLDKISTIPKNLTFDDTFYIGFYDFKDKTIDINTDDKAHLPFILDMNIGGDTDAILKKEIDDFNKAGAKVGDFFFANGKRWDDTLKFSSVHYPVTQTITDNDYTHGYKNVVKWCVSFETTENGLEETKYGHSPHLSYHYLY